MIGSGINPGAYVSQEEAIRIANEIRAAGADIIYCSGLVPEKFAGLRKQHFPCCGHVGYLPVNDTWYGGPRAVGKTAAEAKKVEEAAAKETAKAAKAEKEAAKAAEKAAFDAKIAERRKDQKK